MKLADNSAAATARPDAVADANREREQVLYFDDLSRRAIDALGAQLLEMERSGRSSGASKPRTNPLGDDLDAADLTRIEELLSDRLTGLEPFAEAQIWELAFWRWVVFEGYANKAPQSFPYHQEHLMVSTFYKTGWSLNDFLGARALEIGCGPLGMIEYIPADRRVAFDPLNAKYNKLFARCRSRSIRYLSERSEVVALPGNFDLGICHNVLDHTSDPDFWFNALFDKLRDGGRFIVQLNLSLALALQSEEHRRMHPAPFVYSQIMDWLATKSSGFQHFRSGEATPDGEVYFLAWGSKTSNAAVTYDTVEPMV